MIELQNICRNFHVGHATVHALQDVSLNI